MQKTLENETYRCVVVLVLVKDERESSLESNERC